MLTNCQSTLPRFGFCHQSLASAEPARARCQSSASAEPARARCQGSASAEPARVGRQSSASAEPARALRQSSASAEPARACWQTARARCQGSASAEPARARCQSSASAEPARARCQGSASAEPARAGRQSSASAEPARARCQGSAEPEQAVKVRLLPNLPERAAKASCQGLNIQRIQGFKLKKDQKCVKLHFTHSCMGIHRASFFQRKRAALMGSLSSSKYRSIPYIWSRSEVTTCHIKIKFVCPMSTSRKIYNEYFQDKPQGRVNLSHCWASWILQAVDAIILLARKNWKRRVWSWINFSLKYWYLGLQTWIKRARDFCECVPF